MKNYNPSSLYLKDTNNQQNNYEKVTIHLHFHRNLPSTLSPSELALIKDEGRTRKRKGLFCPIPKQLQIELLPGAPAIHKKVNICLQNHIQSLALIVDSNIPSLVEHEVTNLKPFLHINFESGQVLLSLYFIMDSIYTIEP